MASSSEATTERRILAMVDPRDRGQKEYPRNEAPDYWAIDPAEQFSGRCRNVPVYREKLLCARAVKSPIDVHFSHGTGDEVNDFSHGTGDEVIDFSVGDSSDEPAAQPIVEGDVGRCCTNRWRGDAVTGCGISCSSWARNHVFSRLYTSTYGKSLWACTCDGGYSTTDRGSLHINNGKSCLDNVAVGQVQYADNLRNDLALCMEASNCQETNGMWNLSSG